MASLRRHESDAEQAGLTLHAACGDVLKSLRRCMRSHNLPGDPFALPTPGRRAEPCLPHLRAMEECGALFLESVEVTQRQCAEEVAAARAACAKHRPRSVVDSCETLQTAALSCLSSRLRLHMSSGAPPPFERRRE